MFHQESGVRFRPCFLQKEVVLLCGLQGPGKTAGAAGSLTGKSGILESMVSLRGLTCLSILYKGQT